MSSWETKSKKVYDELLANLAEIEKFGTEFLAEVAKVEKEQENRDDYRLEQLIKNKTEFALKFDAGREAFHQLVWWKIEKQVSHLKIQLITIQNQLVHRVSKCYLITIRAKNHIGTKMATRNFLFEYHGTILNKCFTKKLLRSLVNFNKN